jgi:hypothetical protein
MMVTAHSSTARPVGARPTYPPVSVPRGCHPQDDRVARHDQVLNVQVEIGERLAVAADRLDSGLGPYPERVAVVLAVELGRRSVVSAIPHFVDERPHPRLALGTVHRSPRSVAGKIQLRRLASRNNRTEQSFPRMEL